MLILTYMRVLDFGTLAKLVKTVRSDVVDEATKALCAVSPSTIRMRMDGSCNRLIVLPLQPLFFHAKSVCKSCSNIEEELKQVV